MSNAKKESKFKLGIILFIITFCAGLILGLIFNVTKEPIRKQKELTNNSAMKDLISNADSFSQLELQKPDDILEINEAKKGKDTVGYTLKVSSKGYGGQIVLMVGISNNGSLKGIKILSQSETPGLGGNSTQPSFYEQYKDKSAKDDLEVVKASASNPNQIQALTGATITSKAVTSGVNQAIEFYNEVLEGGAK